MRVAQQAEQAALRARAFVIELKRYRQQLLSTISYDALMTGFPWHLDAERQRRRRVEQINRAGR